MWKRPENKPQAKAADLSKARRAIALVKKLEKEAASAKTLAKQQQAEQWALSRWCVRVTADVDTLMAGLSRFGRESAPGKRCDYMFAKLQVSFYLPDQPDETKRRCKAAAAWWKPLLMKAQDGRPAKPQALKQMLTDTAFLPADPAATAVPAQMQPFADDLSVEQTGSKRKRGARAAGSAACAGPPEPAAAGCGTAKPGEPGDSLGRQAPKRRRAGTGAAVPAGANCDHDWHAPVTFVAAAENSRRPQRTRRLPAKLRSNGSSQHASAAEAEPEAEAHTLPAAHTAAGAADGSDGSAAAQDADASAALALESDLDSDFRVGCRLQPHGWGHKL